MLTTLSNKFKSAIYSVLEKNELCSSYDMRQSNNNKYEMTQTCTNIWDNLRNIKCSLEGNDSYNYHNNINNGILSSLVQNNGKKNIHDNYIIQLQYLDYMDPNNINIISMCVDALNVNYVINEDVFEKYKNDIKKIKALLDIHFSVILQKLYF